MLYASGDGTAQRCTPQGESSTGFVYGRQSKPVTHCFYTPPAAVVSAKYVDPVGIRPQGVMTKGVPPKTWNLAVSPCYGRRSIRDRSLRRVDNCDWHRCRGPLQLQAELRAKCIAELGRSGFTAGTKTRVRVR